MVPQVLLLCLLVAVAMASYSNETLTSLGGDLSVVVYLPNGIKPAESAYYLSSRFEHGSMIGSIHRKVRTLNKDGQMEEKTHILYAKDMWRQPHNEHWPESGVGLASEFGVGDDGAFCNYRCGWNGANDVTNGLLGYREVKIGETFLKIGVGELVKGTCPTCDSTEDYKFNSPYLFAKDPKWQLTRTNGNAIRLEQQATLRQHGYKLLKEISLSGNVLSVTTTLTNLGAEAFSTAWYSHNFFTCDGVAVGPGYSLDLNLRGDGRDTIYEEPGTWSWSTPLNSYAKVKPGRNTIGIDMVRALDPGVRIKSEFTNDGTTNGGFTIRACGTSIISSIPQVEQQPGVSMYGYNLYIERGTFSPEPQIFIHLEPGQATTWTQQLVINDDRKPPVGDAVPAAPISLRSIASLRGHTSLNNVQKLSTFSIMLATAGLVLLVLQQPWNRCRRSNYSRIPEAVL